jgi:hypothetical protein
LRGKLPMLGFRGADQLARKNDGADASARGTPEASWKGATGDRMARVGKFRREEIWRHVGTARRAIVPRFVTKV